MIYLAMTLVVAVIAGALVAMETGRNLLAARLLVLALSVIVVAAMLSGVGAKVAPDNDGPREGCVALFPNADAPDYESTFDEWAAQYETVDYLPTEGGGIWIANGKVGVAYTDGTEDGTGWNTPECAETEGW